MRLGWTWVQHIRNDGWKATIGRTMYGECPTEDAGPGRGTEGLQKGGIKWGEACGVEEDATGLSLFVDLCFPVATVSLAFLCYLLGMSQNKGKPLFYSFPTHEGKFSPVTGLGAPPTESIALLAAVLQITDRGTNAHLFLFTRSNVTCRMSPTPLTSTPASSQTSTGTSSI